MRLQVTGCALEMVNMPVGPMPLEAEGAPQHPPSYSAASSAFGSPATAGTEEGEGEGTDGGTGGGGRGGTLWALALVVGSTLLFLRASL